MSIVDSFKSGYFALEDKYYAVLDKINQYVPIYKVIDPIDRVVPSFLLFILLIVCLILLFFLLTMPTALFNATISVIDQDGNPVPGVSINLLMADENHLFSTDEWGETILEIPAEEVQTSAIFSKPGYITLAASVYLSADETTTITLTGITSTFEPVERVIKVVDGPTNQLMNVRVRVAYSCSNAAEAPLPQENMPGEPAEFRVIQPTNCPTLRATASSDGYESKSKTIASAINYITLYPNTIDTVGTVHVTVRNSDGTFAPNVVVRLIESATTAVVDSSSTSSSGTLSFSAVEPGTYSVTASAADGRTVQKTAVIVTAGETTYVSLTLPPASPPGQGKKILIQLIERGTDIKVANARVILYQDGLPIDSKVSNANGIVERHVNDDNSFYLAVITHSNYITLIKPNIPLRQENSNDPIRIALTRATAENSGKAIVRVFDEDAAPLENASVWLYDSSYPEIPLNNYNERKTGADGNTLFVNLAPSTYFARAKDSREIAEGSSENKDLAPAGTIVLNVTVVIGEGQVEVTVYDAELSPKQRMEGALVQFIDSTDNNVLSSCTTDSTGKCLSGSIKADRFVFVEASKEGYIATGAPRLIDIVKGKTRVSIDLWPKRAFEPPKTLRAEFVGFCNTLSYSTECQSQPTSIQSAADGIKTYYGNFVLVLDEDVEYTGMVHHIRVGPDSELTMPSEGYGIMVRDAKTDWAPNSNAVLLYNCWNGNKADPFTAPANCEVTENAKQASTYYNTVRGNRLLYLTVEFAIEPGLAPGAELRFYYRAKANAAGNTIATEEKVFIFKIGERLTQREDFAWDFTIQRVDIPDQPVVSLSPETPETPYELVVSADYALGYRIYNNSGRDLDAHLSVETKNPAIMSFTGRGTATKINNIFPQSPMHFPNRTELFSSSWEDLQFTPTLETAGSTTELLLELRNAADNMLLDEETLFFTVATGNRMRIIGLPESISDIGMPRLDGQVVDETNQDIKIEGAHVTAIIPGYAQPVPADNPYTDKDGRFSFLSLPGIRGINSIKIKVTAAGYSPLEHTIAVKPPQVIPSPDYECISLKTTDGQELESVAVDRHLANSANFIVETIECSDQVGVWLESELDLSTNYLDLGSTERSTVEVWARKDPEMQDPPLGIGEYPIYLYAKFNSDQGDVKGPLQRITVFVNDSNPALCFRLADPSDPNNLEKMKTTYNISSNPSEGLVYNQCFAYIEDELLPEVRKRYVHAASEEIFGLDYGPGTLSPPEVKTRQFTFASMPLQPGEPPIFTVSNGGGFVTLQWVDVFMTDEQHFGNARHRLWARFFRGQNDWLNLTAMVPYTGAEAGEETRGAVYPLESPFPVVDNQGWIDTDTYHPPDATVASDIPSDPWLPTWQAQHNVCNNNLKGIEDPLIACSIQGTVPGGSYMAGQTVQPYAALTRADKIKLEVEGEGTKLSQIKWQYLNADPNHADPNNPSVGKIDFTLENNNLVGETYALIEVEDTVLGSGLPSQGVEFNWTLHQTVWKEWVEKVRLLAGSGSQTIEPNQMLVLSTDGFNIYNNPDANLATALSEVGSPTPLEINNISVDSPTISQKKVLSIKYFAEGQWHTSSTRFDIEPEPDGYAVDFNLENAMAVEAVALINRSNLAETPVDIVVTAVDLHSFKREAVGSPSTSLGTSRIEPGEPRNGFEIPEELILLPDSPGQAVEYEIRDDSDAVTTYFDDSRTAFTEKRFGDPAQLRVIAVTSSFGEEKVTGSEIFHIRLVGAEQRGCAGYGGLSGKTGAIAKPRVLLNWDWNSIAIDACDASNPDYIYCDPAQFSILLIKRLEKIRQIAAEGIADPARSREVQNLRHFNAYLVQDTFSPDFRNDFVTHYTTMAWSQLPNLHDAGYPWGDYFQSPEHMHFKRLMPDGSEEEPAEIEAGLYEVFIGFESNQFDFFVDLPGENLTETITIKFRKLREPVIDSPFYYLPFNGNLGLQSDGSYDRLGYGIQFNNQSGTIALTNALAREFVATDSDSGALPVATENVSDFKAVNFDNKGMILEIAGDLSNIKFAPSFATPVLMAMQPEADGRVEAYYYLTKAGEAIESPAQGFMNQWTGSGSTMRESTATCKDFSGSPLPFRWQDNKADSTSCAFATEPNSYGYSFFNADPNQKLYYESIFFVPYTENIVLNPGCRNNSQFYSPYESTLAGGLVSLSHRNRAEQISSVQDVIDLVGEEYVCVTTGQDSIKFWWNPQKVLSQLDGVKQKLAGPLDWETDLACTVSIGQ